MIMKNSSKTLNSQRVTYDGLKAACKNSNRSGKWSTPSEVSRLIPKDINAESNLSTLLKKGSIEKKSGSSLYRPTNMAGNISGNNHSAGRRGGGKDVRRDNDRVDRDEGGRRTTPSERRTTDRRVDKPKTQRRRKTADNKKGQRRTGNNIVNTTASLLSSVMFGGGGGAGGMR